MPMRPKEIRANLNFKTLSMPPFTKWRRIKEMSQARRSQRVSKNLFRLTTTKNSSRLCLITIENCSDLRTSNRSWNRRQRLEACQFLRYFHQKRRNFTKRQRKWPTNTVGLSSSIKALELKTQAIAIHSCNTNLESFLTKSMIDSSMRQ